MELYIKVPKKLYWKIRKLLTLCIASFIFISVINTTGQAQTKTAYQKRVELLDRKFLKDIGIRQVYINEIMKPGGMNLNDIMLRSSEVRNAMSRFASSENGKKILINYSLNRSEAKKLMNAADIKRENEAKQAEERKKQLLQEQKEEEQRQYEVANQEKQNKIDSVNQIRKEKRDEEFKYNNSDYIKFAKNIKKDYGEWLQKSEFEKTETYQNRIAKNAQIVFDSLCNFYLKEAIENRIRNLKPNLRIELDSYNADKEHYPVKFTLATVSWLDTLKVNITDAEDFKSTAKFIYGNTLPVNENEWCIHENYLFPINFNVRNVNNKDPITIKVPLTEFRLLTFTANEFEFTDASQKDISYEFNEYQKRLEKSTETKRLLLYEDIIQNARDSYEGGKYKLALEYYKKAEQIKKSESTTVKLGEINAKLDTIQKKYAEILRLEEYKDEYHSMLISRSKRNIIILEEKNKEAVSNYKNLTNFLSNKIELKSANKPKVNSLNNEGIWTANEEEKLKDLREIENDLKVWLQITTLVSNANNKTLKILKKEEDPQILFNKLLEK